MKSIHVIFNSVIISLFFVSCSKKDRDIDNSAKEIQEAWNNNPNNRGQMSDETAHELAKRFYEHSTNNISETQVVDQPIQSSRQSTQVFTQFDQSSDFEQKWYNQQAELNGLIDELYSNRESFLTAINDTDSSGAFQKKAMEHRLTELKASNLSPQSAIAKIGTEIVNDLLPRINAWKASHSEGLPTGATQAAQKILALQEQINKM